MRLGSTSSSVGKRPHAEQAVLGLKPDGHAFGNVVGDQGGHADAEIDVMAVLKFASGARGDADF